MYDLCRGNVPVENAAALAAVHSISQRFLGNDPALGARLGSSPRINLDELAPGACSLVCEHRGQLRPRGIVDMFRQHAGGETLDVEVFDGDAAESGDEISGHLVQVVAAGIADARLQRRHGSLALAADPGNHLST